MPYGELSDTETVPPEAPLLVAELLEAELVEAELLELEALGEVEGLAELEPDSELKLGSVALVPRMTST
jgi:hypothetical protein